MDVLNIKNMVCDRCKKVVKESLEAIGLQVDSVELGRVGYTNNNNSSLEQIKSVLETHGFALLDSEEEKLIERVKIILLEQLQNLPVQRKQKLSSIIADRLGRDYSSISKVFSKNEQITIEKYFIRLKLEKVKELIRYSEMSFSEIAHLLDYSNVNHLSRQFKSETGMSMTEFKHSVIQRSGLDKIV